MEQAQRWPDGPLADIIPPEVRADSGVPPELLKLWEDFRCGRMTDLEAAQALGKVRMKLPKPRLLTP